MTKMEEQILMHAAFLELEKRGVHKLEIPMSALVDTKSDIKFDIVRDDMDNRFIVHFVIS